MINNTKRNNLSIKNVLKTWYHPYPGSDISKTRKKVFKIVTLTNDELAFFKEDSNPDYIGHEADILRYLKANPFAPDLIFKNYLYLTTKYIKGRLLSETAKTMSLPNAYKSAVKINIIVRSVHKSGVIHSDIRLFNFLQCEDGCLYLIDYEYAYIKGKDYDLHTKCLLSQHHNKYLRLEIDDWIDTCSCVSELFRVSNSKILGNIFTGIFTILKYNLVVLKIFSIKFRIMKRYKL